MNNDLISRSALLERLKPPQEDDERSAVLMSDVRRIIHDFVMSAPAVDAETVIKSLPYVKEALEMAKQSLAPVRHGRWANIIAGVIDSTGNCTNCGEEAVWRTRKKPYTICPNCGAKMDGDSHD